MSDCASRPETDRELQRRIVVALQEGLPRCHRPYLQVAAELGISEETLLDTLGRMQASGAVRRIGVVPNHYALGYSHNLMVVWDVDEEQLAALGTTVGQLDFVSHCYRRPRRPGWPYNLFTMVHGRSEAEVQRQVDAISDSLGDALRGHTALRSTRILKKTGLRLRQQES